MTVDEQWKKINRKNDAKVTLNPKYIHKRIKISGYYYPQCVYQKHLNLIFRIFNVKEI